MTTIRTFVSRRALAIGFIASLALIAATPPAMAEESATPVETVEVIEPTEGQVPPDDYEYKENIPYSESHDECVEPTADGTDEKAEAESETAEPTGGGADANGATQCPLSWSLQRHIHHVDRVTRRPDASGLEYRANQTTCTGSAGATLRMNHDIRYSDSWSATIPFEKGPLERAIGASLSGGQRTYNLSFTLGPNRCYDIFWRDRYHVTDMNVHNDWLRCSLFGSCRVDSQQWGSASAKDWFQRNYYVKAV